ncbi:type II toxin-antitoxin system RelE/ParE family toxin [Candidatus Pacearchaeota archaeon]|nr:type II toxin-antitoxin system RelE/ParE family toxin [Candidatus Pacearchaeota archaeon]
MTFSIEWDEKVLNFLRKLPKNISERIFNKIESIKENPFHFLEHYEGGYYKLRIGDYRALIDIDFENKILIVQVLDKIGRIYKR